MNTSLGSKITIFKKMPARSIKTKMHTDTIPEKKKKKQVNIGIYDVSMFICFIPLMFICFFI